MDRAAAIRQSLRGFLSGIVGFLPVIGLIPGVYSLWCWSVVRRRYRDWNPAATYLEWGAMLAVLGLLNSLLAAFVYGLAMIDRLWS